MKKTITVKGRGKPLVLIARKIGKRLAITESAEPFDVGVFKLTHIKSGGAIIHKATLKKLNEHFAELDAMREWDAFEDFDDPRLERNRRKAKKLKNTILNLFPELIQQ